MRDSVSRGKASKMLMSAESPFYRHYQARALSNCSAEAKEGNHQHNDSKYNQYNWDCVQAFV